MVEPDFEVEEQEMTLEEVKDILDGFEREYGMTSQEFYEKWEKGETEWVADSVAWSSLFEAYQAGNSPQSEKITKTETSATDFYIDESDMTLEEVREALHRYERRYGMASKEFYEKWKKGDADWVAESIDWRGLFEAYHILNGQN